MLPPVSPRSARRSSFTVLWEQRGDLRQRSGMTLDRHRGMIWTMTDQAEGRAAEQLAAIANLNGAFTGAGIEYWLFGGWAVDFWVGHVSRDHDDIDAAAWRRDYHSIREALLAAGWQHTPVPNEVVGTRYTWQSSEVEFTFVEPRHGGQVVIPIPEHEIVWTDEPLGENRRSLSGVEASVISLELLRSGKQYPRDAPEEAAKDVADFAALDSL
jgi:aminoglycoside-2''-adenylyltransferase